MTTCLQRPPFWGSIYNFNHINDLWTATTCQQWSLSLGPEGGRCSLVWLHFLNFSSNSLLVLLSPSTPRVVAAHWSIIVTTMSLERVNWTISSTLTSTTCISSGNNIKKLWVHYLQSCYSQSRYLRFWQLMFIDGMPHLRLGLVPLVQDIYWIAP